MKWPWIVGGLVAVIAAGAGALALASNEEQPAAPSTDKAVMKGVDGSFAFDITSTGCGVTTVGPAELPQRPSAGEFCLVEMSVQNTGAEATLLDPGAQRAVDGQGREHAVAEQAWVFLNDQQPSLLDEVAPGATVRGVLAFDVPAGERLTALKLHESMGSTGVRVPLS